MFISPGERIAAVKEGFLMSLVQFYVLDVANTH